MKSLLIIIVFLSHFVKAQTTDKEVEIRRLENIENEAVMRRNSAIYQHLEVRCPAMANDRQAGYDY